MKVLMDLGLVLVILVSFAGQATATKELQEGATVKQKTNDIEVSLASDKRRYNRNDDINLEVKLTNTHGAKDIFVYGTLEFGVRGSLMLYHRDAKGKDVPTQFFPEALTLPPKPNDTSAFVKLLPDHFLGTYYRSSIRTLNMVKPGRYTIWVEYHSPIPAATASVSPFWGSENEIIKSNLVTIEVLP
jgi:hypothetical protein